MSRLGKKPIAIPEGVTVTVKDGTVTVKGSKGELSQEIFEGYDIVVDGAQVSVNQNAEKSGDYPKWGLLTVLVRNNIIGVSEGYQKALIVEGVGYRVQLQGKKLTIIAGFSHPVVYIAPADVDFEVEGANKVIIKGSNKQHVGQVAAEIRSIRPPEPYKGKGIRYDGEHIVRKAGKSNT